MLKKDLIVSQSVLKDLSDEQIKAIETLSENDENVVIGKKTAEIYKAIDDDIKEVTGLDRPASTKTYDFLKSTLKTNKEAADKAKTLEGEITTLKSEKLSLEKQIKEGSTDAALKTKINDLERDIKDKDAVVKKLQDDIVSTKSDYDKKLEAEQSRNIEIRLEAQLSEALGDVKLKEMSQFAKDSSLEKIKADILATGKVEFRKDSNGKEQIVFRDDQDNVITNPNNLQNPYTAKEMYVDALTKAELIDGGRKVAGGGGGGGGGDKVTMNLSSAKSQHSAGEQIRSYLKAQGVPQGTDEFQEQFDKISTDNNISSLPMVDPQ